MSSSEDDVDNPPPLIPRTLVDQVDTGVAVDLTQDEGGVNDNNGNEVVTNTSSSNLVYKRKKVSPVWNCISEHPSGGKCNYCDTVFKLSQGSTSNAVKHLITHHNEVEEVKNMMKEIKEKENVKKQKIDDALKKSASQPKLTSFVRRKGIIDPKKKKNLDEALVKYLVRSNKPFSEVENAGLRNVLFVAEPNYIVPSRPTIKRLFDDMASTVEKTLKAEIQKDIKEAGTMTVHLTSDHGTSNDSLRTKNNVVVLSRMTKDFQLKTDTVAMIKSVGSQTGLQIRKDVKQALIDKAGFDETWKVCWVTDSAANEVNARKPGNHMGVGLYVHFDGSCVDHLLDLVGKDALKIFPEFNIAVDKMKTFVNFLSLSSNARQGLVKIMIQNNMNPLRTLKGTSNRFFSKYFEADRFLELREAIEMFFDQYQEIPDYCACLDNEEWNYLSVYRDTLQLIVKASEAEW